MKKDWIALFTKDYTSKVFTKFSESDDVLIWIERTENGKTHTATSTGNTMMLRDFKFYDKEKIPSTIKFGKWECLSVTEIAKDRTGSLFFCEIKDIFEEIISLRVSGTYPTRGRFGYQPSISDDLYFSAIMLFLRELNVYECWADIKKKNSALFDDITKYNGVPQLIFEHVKIKNEKYLYNDYIIKTPHIM